FSNCNLTNAFVGAGTIQGADFSGAVIIGAAIGSMTAQQLYSTASYQARNLQGFITVSDMTGWDLTNVNLTNANVSESMLTGTQFAGAIIVGANFSRTTSRGFVASQLYSTASYQARDLHGSSFSDDDLGDWDLSGMNLAGAAFQNSSLRAANLSGSALGSVNFQHAVLTDVDLTGSDLTDADLTDADLRGARGAGLTGAITTNTILPDGTINGLVTDITIPTIRNYTGSHSIPIHVKQGWNVGHTVEILFDDQPWGSTISFDAGIPVLIDKTNLQLEFASGIDGSTMIGTSFQIFDWTGVSPNGQFKIRSQFWVWDASELYTTGRVTLVSAVPEPSAAGLVPVVAALFSACTRHRQLRLQPRDDS
ncbi:MAG TPA: pentapeptide repeat-containing protein, partial [Tepidisphaeraceae bacterium]